VHFIGEDNTVFHALIWPAMLMAEGSYQLPWQVVANSFLNIRFSERIEKMSKSRGTALWISSYLERFDPDPLRYYLTAIAPENSRAAFDPEDFVSRNNGELLNALGNFVNRTLTFAQRYGDGRVPAVGQRGAIDTEHLSLIDRTHDQVAEHLEAFRFKAALASLMALARASNQYLDRKQPWKQRKTDPAGCDTTVNVCVQTVRALMVMMAPFLPFSAGHCAAMLEVDGDRRFDWHTATEELPPGHTLGEPRILFRKLELEDLDGWV
jgi:methionyl-tRNA synthetase